VSGSASVSECECLGVRVSRGILIGGLCEGVS